MKINLVSVFIFEIVSFNFDSFENYALLRRSDENTHTTTISLHVDMDSSRHKEFPLIAFKSQQ